MTSTQADYSFKKNSFFYINTNDPVSDEASEPQRFLMGLRQNDFIQTTLISA